MLSILEKIPKNIANPFKAIKLDDSFSRFNRVYLFAWSILCAIVIALNDYAGPTIACHEYKIFDEEFQKNYCWTQGIYTILEAYDVPTKNRQIPYPGIIPEETPCFDFTYKNGTMYRCPSPESLLPLTRVYHLWYQFVPFYFWFCAALFYTPYLAFKNSDIGSIKPLLKFLQDPDLTSDSDLTAVEEEEKRIEKASVWLSSRLSTYIRAEGTLQWLFVKHKFFFIVLLTKMANLATVVLVAYATDNMFAISSYATYGYDWAVFVSRDQPAYMDSPIDKLFPKMVACEVKKWGTTGIVNEAGMCVLAPNVVNSYFFLIFWFVLLLGLIVNAFGLLFSIIAHSFTLGRWKALMTSTFMKGEAQEKWIYFHSGFSGQITLEILAQNISALTFEKVFKRTSEKLKGDYTDYKIYLSKDTRV